MNVPSFNLAPWLAAALLLSGTASAADLTLLERVETTTGVVRLQEVAAILNAGPQEIEALGKIPLMPSPAPGQQHTVRAQSIRELLAAHGVDLTRVRFFGAQQTLIVSPSAIPARPPVDVNSASPIPTTIDSAHTGFRSFPDAPLQPSPQAPPKARLTNHRLQQLTKELTDRLTEHVQAAAADGMLHVVDADLKQHNAAMLAANTGELRIEASTPLRPGPQRFIVSFDTAEGVVKFPVMASIVEARPAVVLRRDVPRGAVVTAADVHVAPLPTSFRARGLETVATSLDDVIGKEAAYGLRAGDVATDANCLPPLMVDRNSLVTVTAGRGAIRVRTQARCRQQGRLGEVIEVESLDTKERYDARVIGRGQLAVLSIGGAAAQALAQDIQESRLR